MFKIFFVSYKLTLYNICMRYNNVFLDSIEASIPACHAGDPGSIPGRGVN